MLKVPVVANREFGPSGKIQNGRTQLNKSSANTHAEEAWRSDVPHPPMEDSSEESALLLEEARRLKEFLDQMPQSWVRDNHGDWQPAEGGGDPFTLAIFGAWGSGKTSFLQHLEHVYGEWDAASKKNKHSFTVWFEPWRYETEHHLLLPLLSEIAGQLNSQLIGAELKKAVSDIGKRLLLGTVKLALRVKATALTGGLNLISEAAGAKVSTDSLVDGIVGLYRNVTTEKSGVFERYEQQLGEVQGFRGDIQDLIARAKEGVSSETRHPVVIFIDDLDRCDPLQVKGLLESIKLFLNEPGILFYFALDRQEVVKVMASAFSNPGKIEPSPNTDDLRYAQGYLDKFFQLGYDVDALSEQLDGKNLGPRKQLRSYLNSRLSPDQKVDIGKIVSELPTNPRRIKRCHRQISLAFDIGQANRTVKFSDKVPLAALHVIGVRFPQIWDAGFAGYDYARQKEIAGKIIGHADWGIDWDTETDKEIFDRIAAKCSQYVALSNLEKFDPGNKEWEGFQNNLSEIAENRNLAHAIFDTVTSGEQDEGLCFVKLLRHVKRKA